MQPYKIKLLEEEIGYLFKQYEILRNEKPNGEKEGLQRKLKQRDIHLKLIKKTKRFLRYTNNSEQYNKWRKQIDGFRKDI